jgi:hypothetical protein
VRPLPVADVDEAARNVASRSTNVVVVVDAATGVVDVDDVAVVDGTVDVEVALFIVLVALFASLSVDDDVGGTVTAAAVASGNDIGDATSPLLWEDDKSVRGASDGDDELLLFVNVASLLPLGAASPTGVALLVAVVVSLANGTGG